MAREPLDELEGPTVWISDEFGNQYTYTIIVGSDPDDPLREIELSKQEIKQAARFVD